MKLVNLVHNLLKEDQDTYGSPVLRKLGWDYEALIEWAAEECLKQTDEVSYRNSSEWDPSPVNFAGIGADYEDNGIYLELQAQVTFDRYIEKDVNYSEDKITSVRSATVTAYPTGSGFDKVLASWDIAEDLQNYFSKNQ